ncbi:YggS family pyridoxal phosphate-dependent enzyme [Aliifodinibius salicampi]|uniref:Pyridoxal phosphate homeostasis protein n=1 Tax=Fodinibius salicampi TaxID=1920655 RepID=A0ABT3Q2Q1_9BACT|nr:YggS family pyridoxal phosphate-dependent enzyme [Fodinibius salicampi]MCW9714390.1 YggS family pyridoxal phosphate-dependent enzyme [Fodinibius salicampi]
MGQDICQNIEDVSTRIRKACTRADRDPEEVQLIAISKMKPLEDIKTAFGCGQLHFGENRAKELQDKMEAYEEDQIQWHMVGNLQTNKIKYMVNRVNWIDSVPKSKTLREIEKRASRIDRVINTLIQINISGEDQKSGCEPENLADILEYAQGLEYVRVRGLMGMATFVDKDKVEKVRPEFQLLREVRDEHRSYECKNIQLDELSMGMTNDMEIAIEEGSTMVRVGRAIFGERNY